MISIPDILKNELGSSANISDVPPPTPTQVPMNPQPTPTSQQTPIPVTITPVPTTPKPVEWPEKTYRKVHLFSRFFI
jgi:hypothetical protein